MKGATATLSDGSVDRIVPIDNTFFLGYRKVNILPTEIMTRVDIPFSKKTEFVQPFKQGKRKQDSVAIANACLRVEVQENGVRSK